MNNNKRNPQEYKETFSPVSTKDSFCIVMTFIIHFDLELHQIDVKTTFLNDNFFQDVYMDQPNDFIETGKKHMVCKLRK